MCYILPRLHGHVCLLAFWLKVEGQLEHALMEEGEGASKDKGQAELSAPCPKEDGEGGAAGALI